MDKISVHEVKSHLSEILRRVESGETVVITRHNRPVAELRSVQRDGRPIKLGAFEGEFEIPEDAFAPMSPKELKDWYGE